MDCTHPVLYHKGGALVCHICGAVINSQEDKQQEEKPAQTAKKAVKRKTKAEA